MQRGFRAQGRVAPLASIRHRTLTSEAHRRSWKPPRWLPRRFSAGR